MTNHVTVLAPIKLAEGKTEADLLAASEIFQTEFVAHEEGVLSRELLKNPKGGYLDVVKFRSPEDFADVMKREMESPVCHAFFAVMDMSGMEEDQEIDLYPVLGSH